MDTDTPGWVKKLAGAGMVLGLVVIVVVSMLMFAGAFTSSEPITITAPRSGLVMDKDAKVKMRGADIGHVESIAEQGNTAVLTLAIDPDMLSLIPSNATVNIASTTFFGAKYVNFVVPDSPSPTHLAAGSSLSADSVTVEFNTLFQHLSDVLAKIEPEKLNQTLGALATALDGRGEKLGQLLSRSDAYLRDINPSLPALQQDFAATAEVTNTYADATPDLLRVLDNTVGISGTIVEEQDNLDRVLLSAIGLADTGNGVLTENESNLVSALGLLQPTTGLLSLYSPVLSCLVNTFGTLMPLANQIFGGLQEGIALNAGFMWGAKPYTYPRDLPKVNATGGPSCHGLDQPIGPNDHAKYVVTDTGNSVYVPSTRFDPNAPKLFQILFAGLPGVAGG